MANPEHLEILKQGVEQWGKWREKHSDLRPDLANVDLSGAELIGVHLSGANLSRANLSRANLSRANLRGADLGVANLRGAHLSPANLDGANLSRANLSEAYLRRADLLRADLRGANLDGANLSRANLSEGNLSAAHLRGASLEEANLSRANLSEAQLSGAQLRGADLSGADLSGADLIGANLSGASLIGANLSGANLSRVGLIGTNLRGAYLRRADLTQATAGETIFAEVDLDTVKGLETVQHYRPSTVGIDTIYRSRGKIPDAFLRGCGIPDDMIGYIRSIAGAIQFYSCFISYSTKDQEFADRLYNDLQGNGVRCWFAPHDIQGGRKLHEQLDEAIRLHDKLLLILSEQSMNSPWVKTEIANARKREEREKKQMLFPITLAPFADVLQWKLFDGDRGIDSAREIREYFIPDFSNWKDHGSYQRAFQRLVKDLKAEGKSAAG